MYQGQRSAHVQAMLRSVVLGHVASLVATEVQVSNLAHQYVFVHGHTHLSEQASGRLDSQRIGCMFASIGAAFPRPFLCRGSVAHGLQHSLIRDAGIALSAR
jgi:hypothetical protein